MHGYRHFSSILWSTVTQWVFFQLFYIFPVSRAPTVNSQQLRNRWQKSTQKEWKAYQVSLQLQKSPRNNTWISVVYACRSHGDLNFVHIKLYVNEWRCKWKWRAYHRICLLQNYRVLLLQIITVWFIFTKHDVKYTI